MTEQRPQGIERVKAQWNKHAFRYDNHYECFEGAVEHFVDMEILKRHLPPEKNAKILDAAGGTGRAALPLAKMGYRMTLCDVAPGMLAVAKEKMAREELTERVEIVECDISSLPFDDERFDMVICWDGMSEKAAQEIVRVTKSGGGRLSVFLVNRLGSALSEFRKNPAKALSMMKPLADHPHKRVDGYAYEPLSLTATEARDWFEGMNVKVHNVYAVCGILKTLQFPEEARNSRDWDGQRFTQTADMLLNLSREPSVKGLAWHLVLYGERR